MALTAGVKVDRRGAPGAGGYGYKVAASEKVFRGGVVALNAAGNLVRPQTSGAVVIAGVCSKDYDNSANGSVSTDTVEVLRGVFAYAVTGATASKLHQPVYATADDTLTMTGPGQTGTAVAGGSNTGNGAAPTVTVTSGALPGDYAVALTSSSAFKVTRPDGVALATGTVGSAYASGNLGFTLAAGGTAFVSGDTFTITVANNATPLQVGTLSGIENGQPYVRFLGS